MKLLFLTLFMAVIFSAECQPFYNITASDYSPRAGETVLYTITPINCIHFSYVSPSLTWSTTGGVIMDANPITSGSTSYSMHIKWPNCGSSFSVSVVGAITATTCSTPPTSVGVQISSPFINPLSVSVTCLGTPTFTLTHDSINFCNKTPITFTVGSVSGATSYSWSYPSGWTVSGSSTGTSITLIPDGSSGGSVTCTASNGYITTSASTNVGVRNPLTATAAFTPILVNGGTSTITVNASNGTPPYSYQVVNFVTGFNHGPQSSNTFTGVPGSTNSYVVLVTDHNGCYLNPSILLLIEQPDQKP